MVGVAFQTHPGSQSSTRGEAKDSALFSSRDAGLLEQGYSPRRASLPSPRLLMPCAGVCAASPLGGARRGASGVLPDVARHGHYHPGLSLVA